LVLESLLKYGGDLMQCKDCENFRKNKRLDITDEFVGSYGTCGMSGSVCKYNDNCKNGNFVKN
jgi:hypothetical protein